MQPTTIGRYLLDQALPEEYRDPERVWDGKTTNQLFSRLAMEYPERYSEVLFKLNQIATDAQGSRGGVSPSIRHTRESEVWKKRREELQQQIKTIYGNSELTKPQKQEQLVRLLAETSPSLTKDVFAEAEAANNPFAWVVKSGMKGKPANINNLLGSPLLFADAKNRPIPIPILRGYARGLTPSEYWAASYGTRKGTVDAKMATADAGSLSKQLTQIAHRSVVTDDDDNDNLDDETRGLPVDTDDDDNIGALLARTTGLYKRNTIITAKVLRDLKRNGVKRMLVRSPVVGGPQDGSVYARDVGMRETGRLPVRGENPGVVAAHALSEPLSQSGLSSKHCLAKGTMIRMADFTRKPIEKIKPGDWVLGVNKDYVASPSQVRNVFDHGVEECQEYIFQVDRTRRHAKVICTDQHRFVAEVTKFSPRKKSKYTRTRSTRVGVSCDKYACVPVSQVADFTGKNESRALLLGLLLGDGCFVKSVHGVYLSCYDDSLIPQLHAYLHTHGLKIAEQKNHYGYYRFSRLRNSSERCAKTGRIISSERNPLQGWLKELGLYGAKSYEKFLPDVVSTWDKRSIAALIGGLWVTDGCIYVTKEQYLALSYGSTSERLVRQIRTLLELRFGICCSPVYKTISGRKRGLYSFSVRQESSIRLFYEEIPLYGVKRGRLKTLLELGNFKSQQKDRRFNLVSTRSAGKQQVYDLEIDSRSRLYVLANCLITHNSAGVVSSQRASISGFKAINQFIQVPKENNNWASHAKSDGLVQKVEAAPQGGHYVYINNEPIYVPQGSDVTVKPGDEIEAGDILSSGLPNPSAVVEHKGIGEGRRYFTQELTKLLRDSNITVNRRNVELIARGLVNHVELDDEMDAYVPGDKVPYNMLEKFYQPREDAKQMSASMATGKYLERPVLHYTVGTRIRPSVVKNLQEFGLADSVTVHDAPPPFRPQMVRGMAIAAHDPDWLASMQGSGIKARTLTAVHRGHSSDPLGTSYVSGIVANPDFAKPGTPGKIEAPINRLLEMRRKRLEAPANPFDLDDED